MKRAVAPLVGFAAGAAVLVALSVFQKLAIGAPLVAEGFVVPCLFGGSVGVLLALWRGCMARQQASIRELSNRFEQLAAYHVADGEPVGGTGAHAETASSARQPHGLSSEVKDLVHEVGQPLYAISNYAQASIDTLDGQDQRQRSVATWNREILVQTERAAAVLRRLTVLVNPPLPEDERELREMVLNTCRSVVEPCGGSVAVDTDQEDGLVVRFRFNGTPEEKSQRDEHPSE